MAENATQTKPATPEQNSLPAIPALPSLPTPPAALSIDFDGPKLTADINEATMAVESSERLSAHMKAMRRALLLDPSYAGKGRTDRVGPTRSTLTSAADFLTAQESASIYVEGPMPYTIESLRFNPNAAGKAFNLIDSRLYVLDLATVSAIERAINAGWQGETQDAIDRQLAAANERLELLKSIIPKVSEGKAVETYVCDIYRYVAARLESVQAPLAEALAAPLDYTTPMDFEFLSTLAGIKALLHKAREITTRWMLKFDDGGIAGILNAVSDQMAEAENQVRSAAESRAVLIGEVRSRLGK